MLSSLQQETGSGPLTAYLGGLVFLQLASQFFQVGVLFSGLVFFFPIVFILNRLVIHFRYKQGNTYPLVLGLSLGIGNNDTAENKREKKPERGKYNQDGKQGKRSWKRQPEKYK